MTLKVFKTTLADLVNGDGATNTIMLVDNGDLEEWNYAPTEYHVGIVWDDNFPNRSIQLINKYVLYPNMPPNTKPPIGLLGLSSANSVVTLLGVDALAYARPLSNHPGGFMATFCDGRTKFISESVAYAVYAKLMTSCGKKYAAAGASPSGSYAAMRTLLSVPIVDGDY